MCLAHHSRPLVVLELIVIGVVELRPRFLSIFLVDVRDGYYGSVTDTGLGNLYVTSG